MKRNLWIMYAIALLQGMVFYGPIATLYRQAHGITIFQITLIESISLALLILLEIPWGIIADKIGCRHTIIVCSVLYLISKIVFWKADGFAGFLVERIMLSVVESGFSGVDSTILYLSCGQKNSQKVFGIYHHSIPESIAISKMRPVRLLHRTPLCGSYPAGTFWILFLLCHRTAGNLQLPSALLLHGDRFLPYPGSDPSGVPVCGGHPDPQIQQYFVPASPDRNPEPADPDRQPRHCS